ncbi:hypothetical protein E2C01_071310 [Portunus trituberculatus]|uniref:Uncharacterized protein n=1 Tax=Portunus trituberculatus TaxID=210409 RepID=A0A5B7I434_PORTR|nr:hypothetical protein [Portunus trituberculatus]
MCGLMGVKACYLAICVGVEKKRSGFVIELCIGVFAFEAEVPVLLLSRLQGKIWCRVVVTQIIAVVDKHMPYSASVHKDARIRASEEY